MKRNTWYLFLATLSAIGPISIDMYLPAMPSMALAFDHVDPVQESVASYLLGVLMGQPVYGIASDRYGRKPVLFAGLLTYCVSSFACACARQGDLFVAIRFVQGIGGGAGMVIARAMIRDRMDTHQAASAFSMLMLVVSVAPLTAPLFGTVLLNLAGWRSIFAAMGVIGVFTIFASVAAPETRSASKYPRAGWRYQVQVYGRILLDRQFLIYTVSNGLLQGGMYAYISMSSFVIVGTYHQSPAHFSLIFTANSLGIVIAAQINAYLIKNKMFALPCIVKAALWISVGTSILMVIPSEKASLTALFILFFLYLSMIGFVAPNSAAIALARHAEHAGSASALLGMLLLGIGVVSGMFSSHVLPESPARALILVMATCSLLATLVFQARPSSEMPNH